MNKQELEEVKMIKKKLTQYNEELDSYNLAKHERLYRAIHKRLDSLIIAGAENIKIKKD